VIKLGKKVLVLSGSPRRGGNSDLLCDQLIKGAEESGNQVEKIFLRNMHINYCLACDGCKRNKGECAIKDDMAGILENMIDADVIVMATPVYFYSIDAQMKTLIDRTVARYTEIEGKEFYFIMTAADEEKHALDRTLECFRGFTDCLPGSMERGVVYGSGVWHKGEISGTSAMAEAYQYGRNI
jgi:multimeric flavodoxin WrbA